MDATLVTDWTALCQLLAPAFTGPTFETFLHIVTGWALCRSKPVVTSLVCTIGQSLLGHAAKHWTTYERYFYRARWSLPQVSRLLLVRLIAPLVESVGVERVIDLNLDDTTCGRCGNRRVLAVVCLWYHVSKDRPIKLLIVRDPSGQQADDYMFCTDPAVGDVEIIERFSGRWPIEKSFHDGKQLDGFEQVQGWCPRTVVRQAPLALIVQTLVKAWYLRHGVRARSAQPHGTDWMPDKDHPSYLDMLATLRKVLWTDRININSTRSGRVRALLKTLAFTLCAAA